MKEMITQVYFFHLLSVVASFPCMCIETIQNDSYYNVSRRQCNSIVSKKHKDIVHFPPEVKFGQGI